MVSKQSLFWQGVKDMIPMMIGVIPFGFIFGSLITIPLHWWHGALMSASIFAGSSQLVAIGLIAGNTSYFIILATTFMINLRHVLYSASLSPYVAHLPLRWRITLGALICDETFAIVEQHYEKNPHQTHNHYYFLGAALALYFEWQLLTCLGLVFGNAFPILKTLGLDFAMAITFLSIILLKIHIAKYLITAIVTAICAYYFRTLPYQLGLLISMLSGMSSGLLFSYLQKKYFSYSENL